MAEIRDEYGNPIQLTDAHGNPVQLTDEYGNPMHLTGVVTTTADADKRAASGKMTTDGTGTNGAGGALQHDQQEQQKQQNEEQKQQHEDKRSSSSSSSSSEDEGHGGNGDQVDQGVGGEQGRRRKKKGLKEKIKEKLTGGKHKDEHEHTAVTTHSHITSMHTAVTTHSPTGPGSEHHEHEKKGVMEKIKEKLPGHHTSF